MGVANAADDVNHTTRHLKKHRGNEHAGRRNGRILENLFNAVHVTVLRVIGGVSSRDTGVPELMAVDA
jgi:hypothetical protein